MVVLPGVVSVRVPPELEATASGVAAATAMTGADQAAAPSRLRRLNSGRLDSGFFVKMTFLRRVDAARSAAVRGREGGASLGKGDVWVGLS